MCNNTGSMHDSDSGNIRNWRLSDRKQLAETCYAGWGFGESLPNCTVKFNRNLIFTPSLRRCVMHLQLRGIQKILKTVPRTREKFIFFPLKAR